VSPSLRGLLGRGAPEPQRAAAPAGLLDVLRSGPVPVAPGAREALAAERLHVGVVVPQFRPGSGGHGTIANLVRGLHARGHRCELFVLDEEGRHAGQSEAQVAADFNAFFGTVDAPVRLGLERWNGADVALATGWQTVPAVLRLGSARSRAYLVQDHEPEFYPTSAERDWAAWTYRQGLHHIAASPWLASVIRSRYGGAASAFDLGVDHARYHPPAEPGSRRADLVVFYARASTPRRAVPLGLLALDELLRRRPAVDVALFGQAGPVVAPAGARDVGVLDGAELAELYGRATVGLVLSMTNPSLVPLEMLACELPVVDLASASMLAEFGEDGPAALAPGDPLALCDTIEQLLDDPARRAVLAARGSAFVASRTWDAAAEQVDHGLREALREAAGAGGAA